MKKEARNIRLSPDEHKAIQTVASYMRRSGYASCVISSNGGSSFTIDDIFDRGMVRDERPVTEMRAGCPDLALRRIADLIVLAPLAKHTDHPDMGEVSLVYGDEILHIVREALK